MVELHGWNRVVMDGSTLSSLPMSMEMNSSDYGGSRRPG